MSDAEENEAMALIAALTAKTKENMKNIDLKLSQPKNAEASTSKPPEDIKMGDEVEWWQDKIACLSARGEPSEGEEKSSSGRSGFEHKSRK